MKFFVLLILILGLQCAEISDLENLLTPCDASKLKQHQMNSCLKQNFILLLKFLAPGSRNLNVPPFDPFKIPKLHVKNDRDGYKFSLNIGKLVITGGKHIQVVEVRSNVRKHRIEIKIFIPELVARGLYDGAGYVAGFPARAKGNFVTTFYGISAIARLYGSEKIVQGERYFNIKNFKINLISTDANFKIQDSLNPPLSEAYGAFLFSNRRQVLASTKDTFLSGLDHFFKDIFQSAFTVIPMRVFYTL